MTRRSTTLGEDTPPAIAIMDRISRQAQRLPSSAALVSSLSVCSLFHRVFSESSFRRTRHSVGKFFG